MKITIELSDYAHRYFKEVSEGTDIPIKMLISNAIEVFVYGRELDKELAIEYHWDDDCGEENDFCREDDDQW
jgi:hypothetical protein